MNFERMYTITTVCDHRYDGSFYVAVRTTGIYCLPSCTARLPLRKNVEFVASQCEAESKGYRACKRCHPDRFVARVGARQCGVIRLPL